MTNTNQNQAVQGCYFVMADWMLMNSEIMGIGIYSDQINGELSFCWRVLRNRIVVEFQAFGDSWGLMSAFPLLMSKLGTLTTHSNVDAIRPEEFMAELDAMGFKQKDQVKPRRINCSAFHVHIGDREDRISYTLSGDFGFRDIDQLNEFMNKLKEAFVGFGSENINIRYL